jgi:hypothetical protein
MMPSRQKKFPPDKPFPCFPHLTCKEFMKKSILICSFGLLVSGNIMAQKQDSIPARSLAEKGSHGDVLLGKEHKKAQLSAAPQMLNAADSSQKKDIHSKLKKNKPKKN